MLLSEASSLTAREFVTVLGSRGIDVEVLAGSSLPIVRFSRWCRAVHRAPSPSADPVGYLRAVDALMASGRFRALLATHEQAWLFAAGRELLTNARGAVAVASEEAFDHVQSKLAFARAIDAAGLTQPAWHPVEREADLDAVGFPAWVKAAFSTAGRGVILAHDHDAALRAWRRLTAAGGGAGDADGVMVQAPADGTYAQVQGVFDDGALIAAAVSERLVTGAGGSAAARISADHPLAVDALARFGAFLRWHGGLCLDYFHRDGVPQFIEGNPRITEPGNAAAAGVDLPGLLIALARGEPPAGHTPLVTRPGVRTRSALGIAIGAAETVGTRRAVASALAAAVTRRPPLQGSAEVLTPVIADPPSAVPFVAVTIGLLTRPASVTGLAGATIAAYSVTPAAIRTVTGSTDRDRRAT